MRYKTKPNSFYLTVLSSVNKKTEKKQKKITLTPWECSPELALETFYSDQPNMKSLFQGQPANIKQNKRTGSHK